MKIRLDWLEFLHTKLAETPLNAPKRFEHISEQVEAFQRQENDKVFEFVDIDIDDIPLFKATPSVIGHIASMIPRTNIPHDEISKFGLKVITPVYHYCCEKPIRIDSRPAKVKIYGLNGIIHTLYYHGNCRVCKSKIYHSYSEDKNGYRKFNNNSNYFVISTGIGFTVQLLQRYSLDISIGNTAFFKLAEIYNEEFNLHPKDLLDPAIIEANWLIFRVSGYINVIQWERKLSNSCYHVEKICLGVYEKLKTVIDKKWMNHVCKETGCFRRMIVMDGNEKLYRYCCSKPFDRVLGGKGETNMVKRCVNNPLRGNQNQSNSDFCALHVNGSPSPVCVTTEVDLRPVTRSYAKTIQETITTSTACKELKNINKFEKRTAGMFYLMRSCGIRLSHYEMFSAESLSSIVTYLLDTFSADPKKSDISGIVYDRSCDLHPYLTRLAAEENDIAKKFCMLKFIVDIFHCEKHTLPKCLLGNVDCAYHPDLPQFSEERSMNMEIAEQTFHLLNPYKQITRNMTYAKRLCFLKIIDDDHNTRLEKKIKSRSDLLSH
jgi:hypothetical protein